MTIAKSAVLALLLVAAVAGLALYSLRAPSKVAPPATSTVDPPPAGTAVAPQTVPCRILPRQSVWAGTLATGTVEAVYVEQGATVVDGQTLARLNSDAVTPTVAAAGASAARAQETQLAATLASARAEASRQEAEVKRAQAALARAEPVFLKQKALYEAGATPRLAFEAARSEFDRATAALAMAGESSRQADNRASQLADQLREAARVAQAKAQAVANATPSLSAAEIHAPAAGLVMERNIAAGTAITEKNRAELFRIAVDPALLRAGFPQVDPGLQPGDSVSLAVDRTQIRATVTSVENGTVFADFESRTADVRFDAPCQVSVRK